MIDNEKMIAAALREMVRLGDLAITTQLSISDTLIVVAHLQLALRHPTKTVSGSRARSLCDDIIATVESQSAELAAFMRLGYDEKYDMPNEAIAGARS
jgi:hypothetical protein